jgi:hypothetical protein
LVGFDLIDCLNFTYFHSFSDLKNQTVRQVGSCLVWVDLKNDNSNQVRLLINDSFKVSSKSAVRMVSFRWCFLAWSQSDKHVMDLWRSRGIARMRWYLNSLTRVFSSLNQSNSSISSCTKQVLPLSRLLFASLALSCFSTRSFHYQLTD